MYNLNKPISIFRLECIISDFYNVSNKNHISLSLYDDIIKDIKNNPYLDDYLDLHDKLDNASYNYLSSKGCDKLDITSPYYCFLLERCKDLDKPDVYYNQVIELFEQLEEIYKLFELKVNSDLIQKKDDE